MPTGSTRYSQRRSVTSTLPDVGGAGAACGIAGGAVVQEEHARNAAASIGRQQWDRERQATPVFLVWLIMKRDSFVVSFRTRPSWFTSYAASAVLPILRAIGNVSSMATQYRSAQSWR